MDLPLEQFRAEVEASIASLPANQRVLLDEVAVEVSDLPALGDLQAVEPPFSPTILGIFRGLPLGVERAPGQPPAMARTIVLYRKNLMRAVKSRAELSEQIRRTLIHEIGHVSGLDEDALRRRGLE